MTFVEIVPRLREGCRLKRKGWVDRELVMLPGTDQLYIVDQPQVWTTSVAYAAPGGTANIDLSSTSLEKAPAEVRGWNPRLTSLLADDWEVVTDEAQGESTEE